VEDAEQAAEFDCFLAHCRPGMVLFDIGAHFGLFSLAALHYGGPTAQAVAVDASPTAARMIQIQTRLNAVGERLQVLQACVCDHPGHSPMVAVGVQADGYFVAPSPDHPPSEATLIKATTLDCLMDEFHLRPSHVKIDVEGFEGSVLRGGKEVLGGQPSPVLFLELHNQIIRQKGEDPAETVAFVEGLGYTIFDVVGRPVSREALLAPPLVRCVARREGSASCTVAASVLA
jgi:FkbM family methyltransferase